MTTRLALFDIDGVLADERHRTHHALARDWGAYFNPGLVKRDGVWAQGRLLYEDTHLAGFHVGYLTGRREDLRGVTTRWLGKEGFDPGLPLIMRSPRHRSSDGYTLAVLKAGIVAEALHLYDEVWLFDDDPAVIEAVSQVQGATAVHCTWHVKPARQVRLAVA